MQKLNLPEYEHRIRKNGQGTDIFDPVRHKYVTLSPEEWVRQNFIRFLIEEKNTPLSLIGVEIAFTLNTMQRRSDIVVHNRNGEALLAVECKAANVKISQEIFNQIVRYNLILQAPYLIVTNGLQHFCCKVNFETKKFNFLREIPDFTIMNGEKP